MGLKLGNCKEKQFLESLIERTGALGSVAQWNECRPVN